MKRALILTLLLAVMAAPAFAQQKKKDKRGFVWKDRPAIVFGKNVSVEVTGRALLDWRWFDPDIGEDVFALRAGRIGLKGELTKHFAWEVEREIGVNSDDPNDLRLELGQWKDVYGRWKTYDQVNVKAGRFKLPFGLEQNTGVSELDFAYRALGSRTIAPGRDTGVMAYGDLGRVGYEFGVFDDDGDNADSNEPQFAEPGKDSEAFGPSFAGRVTGDLLRLLPVPKEVRSATFGFAYTNSKVPEGLNSLRGRNFWATDDFVSRVYVKGRRQRFGTQFDWSPGPASIKMEWMQSREQRKEQSNRDADLSDFIGEAWYVAGTWLVTGEDKGNDIKVKRPLLKGGIGAIELAVRYDELGFRSGTTEGPAFTNPRADHQVPNKDQVWTLGVNWITTKWSRVILNAIHEQFEDHTRTPVSGETSFWSGTFRLNIVF